MKRWVSNQIVANETFLYISTDPFEEGTKERVRSEKFSDHYSQARQFYESQTSVEKNHIANALIFELSKVEKIEIRLRMEAYLLNIDKMGQKIFPKIISLWI